MEADSFPSALLLLREAEMTSYVYTVQFSVTAVQDARRDYTRVMGLSRPVWVER